MRKYKLTTINTKIDISEVSDTDSLRLTEEVVKELNLINKNNFISEFHYFVCDLPVNTFFYTYTLEDPLLNPHTQISTLCYLQEII